MSMCCRTLCLPYANLISVSHRKQYAHGAWEESKAFPFTSTNPGFGIRRTNSHTSGRRV